MAKANGQRMTSPMRPAWSGFPAFRVLGFETNIGRATPRVGGALFLKEKRTVPLRGPGRVQTRRLQLPSFKERTTAIVGSRFPGRKEGKPQEWQYEACFAD